MTRPIYEPQNPFGRNLGFTYGYADGERTTGMNAYDNWEEGARAWVEYILGRLEDARESYGKGGLLYTTAIEILEADLRAMVDLKSHALVAEAKP